MFIIAEAGLNYSGSIKKAFEYCEAAKYIGADAVKFQLTESDIDIIKACEMPEENWMQIKKYCDDIHIEFMATPSTVQKLDFLLAIGCKKIKIGSDRALQFDLINKLQVISEITNSRKPDRSMNEPIITIISNGHFKVYYSWAKMMYCISDYPTEPEKINFYEVMNYPGLSDHTLEFNYRWAEKIQLSNVEYYEKHFKLDDNCIDAKSSLTVYQFKELAGYLK
jgi:N,N'-diacetyllegionaminate synthase